MKDYITFDRYSMNWVWVQIDEFNCSRVRATEQTLEGLLATIESATGRPAVLPFTVQS